MLQVDPIPGQQLSDSVLRPGRGLYLRSLARLLSLLCTLAQVGCCLLSEGFCSACTFWLL